MNQSAHNLQMSCNEQFDITVSVMDATMTRDVNPHLVILNRLLRK